MVSITLIIIIITCLVSFTAFNNEKILNDLIFYPPSIAKDKQYYRFFTCGFIHADYLHLGFNMWSLYIFGQYLESRLLVEFGLTTGKVLYILLYVSSLFFCLIPTYRKNRDNYAYRSLGASGAVSAVVFASFFLEPTQMQVRLFLMPSNWGIPAFIFGFIYLIISTILDKRGGGNINHSAHIWGALYGVAFLVLVSSFLLERNLLSSFIYKVGLYFSNL